MRCFWFLAVVSGLLWTTFLAAQEKPKAKDDEAKARDAAVLETVLIDLLTQPNSPVEPRNAIKKEIHFYPEALRYEIKAVDVVQIGDEKKLEKLPTDQLAKAREAAEHLTQRVEKRKLFKEFVPKDNRIKLYLKEKAGKDKEPDVWIGGQQVFRAYSPGYSRDNELAIVRLSFGWSGNFHSAAGIYVLQKQKDGWTVLLRDLVFYA